MKKNKKLSMGRAALYRVIVPGRYPDLWTNQGDRLCVEVHENWGGKPATSLTGEMDQAALLGLLRQLYSLGLPILSASWIEGGGQAV